MKIPENAGMSYALASIGKAFEGMGYAMGQMTYVASEMAHILIQSMPIIRRARIEDELGYRVPNWIYNVWEYRRRTEGSGNGREMRD